MIGEIFYHPQNSKQERCQLLEGHWRRPSQSIGNNVVFCLYDECSCKRPYTCEWTVDTVVFLFYLDEKMFDLIAPYQPAGDQPKAIDQLIRGLRRECPHQTLLGVTGSGKTFTVANVIAKVNRPTLVISHNKTLAAQLYAEFKGFFPHNAVEYFVSYFDYYQPEAYIPQTDTFIEKDSSINDEIERMRLSTMSSLFSRRDVVVVASVSCIYGIGSKEDYEAMLISIRTRDSCGANSFWKS